MVVSLFKEAHAMFETLFTYPAVLRRHKEGPLAVERARYLTDLAAKSVPRTTLLMKASYCRRVAVELQQWPSDRCFDKSEVEEMASGYSADGPTSSNRRQHAKEHFRSVATDFLRSLGRLRPRPTPLPDQYDAMLSEFIALQQEGKWLSELTRRAARWQLTVFLNHLERRGMALADVEATDIDAFYEHMALRWGRTSLHRSATVVRAWLRYCETKGYARLGLADAILLPRIYRDEALPMGPTWDTVGRMLAATSGDDPVSIRNHAIILLLAVYGLRSGEVRHLRLDDVDWPHNRIRFVRSKSRRREEVPLEARVGNAIARYLRDVRPQTSSRFVFLRLLAPYGPLSPGSLYSLVMKYLLENERPRKGCGPHGLRHACARHLLESGKSFKEVGDHLGHRSPDTTRIYAKVNLNMLRQVAFDDLGGLA